MESSQSNHHRDQDEESSDEEAEDLNDNLGTGRSYECVFCKRGFTTAQALGGHMNIHRKDRVKPRSTSAPSSIASKAADDQHVISDVMRSHRYPSPHFVTAPEVNVNYRTYIPVPTWDIVGQAHHSDHELCARNYNPVRLHQNFFATDDGCRNWRSGSGLTLGIGTSADDEDHDHHKEETERSNGACSSEGDGLDLELRLGHDP